MAIAQGDGHGQHPTFADVAAGLGNPHGRRVRLRCAGQIRDGLCQRQLALREPHQFAGLRRRHGQRQGGRIGIAHVLAGQDYDPPGEKPHVLASFEHAGKPVQGGVGITAPNALDQRTDRVVVRVA